MSGKYYFNRRVDCGHLALAQLTGLEVSDFKLQDPNPDRATGITTREMAPFLARLGVQGTVVYWVQKRQRRVQLKHFRLHAPLLLLCIRAAHAKDGHWVLKRGRSVWDGGAWHGIALYERRHWNVLYAFSVRATDLLARMPILGSAGGWLVT